MNTWIANIRMKLKHQYGTWWYVRLVRIPSPLHTLICCKTNREELLGSEELEVRDYRTHHSLLTHQKHRLPTTHLLLLGRGPQGCWKWWKTARFFPFGCGPYLEVLSLSLSSLWQSALDNTSSLPILEEIFLITGTSFCFPFLLHYRDNSLVHSYFEFLCVVHPAMRSTNKLFLSPHCVPPLNISVSVGDKIWINNL